MAKFCLNCNKSIGLFDKPYKLPSLDVCFCERCKDKVEPLFRQIDSVSTIANGIIMKDLDLDFENKSMYSTLPRDVFETVKKAFRLKQIEKGRMYVFIRTFEASFHDSYEAIRSAWSGITNYDVTANIITTGNVKTATFIFEKPEVGLSNTFGSTLVVTLTHNNETAVVTSKGTVEVGYFHELNYDFWKEFERQNPDLEIKNIWDLDYDR